MGALTPTIERLERKARSSQAVMMGMAEDLLSLAASLRVIERQQAALAAAVQRMHYWPGEGLDSQVLDELHKISEDGDLIAGITPEGVRSVTAK